MDYKIVLMKGAEEDFDRFIAYLLFEKKTEQVARHLLNDFEATKIGLSNVARSLKLCDNPKLRELGYRSIIESVDSNEVYVLDVSKNVPLLAPNSTVEDNHDHEDENHDHDADTDHNHEDEDHDHDAEVEAGHDHSEGDGHNHTYDPHIWTSPKNAMIMVNNILEALCEVDPENADYYKDNANAYLAELEELDHELKDVVANAKRDTIYHGGRFAMQYLTNQYGIHYVSAPFEAEPSAALVAQMIKEIKEQNISVIYYEELVDPKISQMISDETGAKMLLLHSCHNVSKEDFNNGVTYLSLMKQNVENLKVGLD